MLAKAITGEGLLGELAANISLVRAIASELRLLELELVLVSLAY